CSHTFPSIPPLPLFLPLSLPLSLSLPPSLTLSFSLSPSPSLTLPLSLSLSLPLCAGEEVKDHGAIRGQEKCLAREEPFSLPEGFSWATLDIQNPAQVREPNRTSSGA